MAKKKVERKKTVSSSKVRHSRKVHESDAHIERVLVENFVALQKVMTHLSTRFDNLSTQISKLLDLFEISAKTMAQKDFEFAGKDNSEMIKRMDNLLEQNKVIARGLTLLHEPESRVVMAQSSANMPPQPIPVPRPSQGIPPPMLPRPSMVGKPQMAIEEDSSRLDMRDYQKSEHIDESSNLAFDIGRNKKEEGKSSF